MPVFTLIAYRQTSTFKARDRDQLRTRLYRRTSWTEDACGRIADQLLRGIVYLALDYETVVLPGRWDHLNERPEGRPEAEWDASDVPPDDSTVVLRGPDTPLLSGGVK